MKLIASAAVTFSGVLSIGILGFLYLYPDGGIVQGMLQSPDGPHVARNIVVTTTLLLLNVTLLLVSFAFFIRPSPRVRMPMLFISAVLTIVAIADLGLGFWAVSRSGSGPLMSWLSLLAGVTVFAFGFRPSTPTRG